MLYEVITDKRTGLTINSKTFVKKGKLSGIVKNGVELDSSNSDNIRITSYNVCYTKLLRYLDLKQALTTGVENSTITIRIVYDLLTTEAFMVR